MMLPFYSIAIWLLLIVLWIVLESRKIRRSLRLAVVGLLILVFPVGMLELAIADGILNSKGLIMMQNNVNSVIQSIESDRQDELAEALEAYQDDLRTSPTLYDATMKLADQLVEHDLWY